MFSASRLCLAIVPVVTALFISISPAAESGYASLDKPVQLGYPLRAMPIGQVKIDPGFWADRLKTHMEVTIPHVLKCLKIDYDDPKPSRSALALARALEGAAYCLMIKKDPKLDAMMEKICAAIGEEYKNGNRWFGVKPEAAAYYYLATGKVTGWLKAGEEEFHVRKKEFFNDDWTPKLEPVPHAFIEMASTSMYRATGDKYYKRLIQAFMDSRGMPATKQRLWPKFAAQHKPVEEMKEPGGHAGSFGWFAAGLVDVGALTGEKKYLDAAVRIWKSLVDTRMCITGGTGAISKWEGFGDAYAINRRGYNETCAASGQVFYNYRLGMLTLEGKYFDMMEAVLLNGYLSGVSLSGDHFYYCNPLESGGGYERKTDRRVPCCHGSVCRTTPQVPGYMYAHTDSDIYVTLYAANSTKVPLKNGAVGLKQETKYPFDGKISLTVSPAKEGQKFNVRLRIPTWAQEKFIPGGLYSFTEPPPKKWEIRVNDQAVTAKIEKGFAVVERSWKSGDKLHLNLPMPVRFSTCIDKVEAYKGRVAATRGPLVYCAEEADNKFKTQRIAVLKLPKPEQIKVSQIPEGILKGVAMVSFPGVYREEEKDQPVEIHLVPYYSWNNRGAKSMSIWFPHTLKAAPMKDLTWIPAGSKDPPRSVFGSDSAINFENKSGQTVKLYWIGYRGHKNQYGELKPGDTRSQNTYSEATWLITDTKDVPLGHFRAGPYEARAVIPAKSAKKK